MPTSRLRRLPRAATIIEALERAHITAVVGAGAEALFAKYGSISDELTKDLEKARSVPVEIEPIYRTQW